MATGSSAASGDMLALLAALDRLETLSALALVLTQQARSRKIEALEILMTASQNVTDALAREDAAVSALEQTQTSIHGVITDLRTQLEARIAADQARIAADQATLAQLDTLSARVETVTGAEQTDVTPPAPAV